MKTGSASRLRENAAHGTHAEVERLLLGEPGLERVADIPCGRGAFLARLAGNGLEAIGIDIVDERAGQYGNFRTGDMNEPLPFADGELDALVSIDGIEHIERQFDFVRECARSLRSGGRLVLSTPNISSLRSRWRWLWTGFHDKAKAPLDAAHPTPLHHISMIDFPKLAYMLERSGLVIESVSTNRVKAAAWLQAPLAPLAALAARRATRRVISRDTPASEQEEHRESAARILAWMNTRAVLFGEILIVVARRGPPAGGDGAPR